MSSAIGGDVLEGSTPKPTIQLPSGNAFLAARSLPRIVSMVSYGRVKLAKLSAIFSAIAVNEICT